MPETAASDLAAAQLPMGARFSLAARALAYGEKVEYSMPIYDSLQVEGADAVLHFTHLGGGVVAKDGEFRFGQSRTAKNDVILSIAGAKTVGTAALLRQGPALLAGNSLKLGISRDQTEFVLPLKQ